jgi:hypothetical protein
VWDVQSLRRSPSGRDHGILVAAAALPRVRQRYDETM